MMKTLLLTPILFLAGSVAALAEPTREVGYADLDLTQPAAVNRLDTRLQRAARQVCQPSDPRELHAVLYARECRATALASARKQAREATATAQARTALRQSGG